MNEAHRIQRKPIILKQGYQRASLVTQVVTDPPAVQRTRLQPLGQEDPLEKGMATHSSILVWRVPWTEEPGGLQSTSWQSQTRLSTHTHSFAQDGGDLAKRLWEEQAYSTATPKTHLGQFSSVAQSRPTLCNPVDCSTPGLPVHHQFQELTQTHVRRVGDAVHLAHSFTKGTHGSTSRSLLQNSLERARVPTGKKTNEQQPYSHSVEHCVQYREQSAGARDTE